MRIYPSGGNGGSQSIDLGQVQSPEIRQPMVAHFYEADKDYGTRLAKAVNVTVADVQRTISAHPEQFAPASN